MKVAKLIAEKAKQYQLASVTAETRNEYDKNFKVYIVSGFLANVQAFANDDKIADRYALLPGSQNIFYAK